MCLIILVIKNLILENIIRPTLFSKISPSYFKNVKIKKKTYNKYVGLPIPLVELAVASMNVACVLANSKNSASVNSASGGNIPGMLKFSFGNTSLVISLSFMVSNSGTDILVSKEFTDPRR